MKMIKVKSLFAASAMVLSGMFMQAQTLEEVIAKNLPNMDMRKSANELMPTVAQFDLAAGQFPDQWAAHYYAGFAKVTLSYTMPEGEIAQKDMVLDEADAYLAKAKELGPDNSETYVLAAMVANARLAVDGQNRWQKYGALFRENLEKAKSLNADNPRIYYNQGASVFWTPEMFGGGKKAALEHFLKAKPLFEKESKASLLVPYWGNEVNEWYISECNKPDEEPVKEEPGKGKKDKEKKNKGN